MPQDPQDPLESTLLEAARAKLSKEMPAEAAASRMEPMGWFDHLLTPASAAMSVGPSNVIKYDGGQTSRMGQTELEDLLAHELTHVRQNQRGSRGPSLLKMAGGAISNLLGGGSSYYGQDSRELEAFQTMNDRALREGRAPNPDYQHPFQEGAYRFPLDLDLDELEGTGMPQSLRLLQPNSRKP